MDAEQGCAVFRFRSNCEAWYILRLPIIQLRLGESSSKRFTIQPSIYLVVRISLRPACAPPLQLHSTKYHVYTRALASNIQSHRYPIGLCPATNHGENVVALESRRHGIRTHHDRWKSLRAKLKALQQHLYITTTWYYGISKISILFICSHSKAYELNGVHNDSLKKWPMNRLATSSRTFTTNQTR